MTLAEMRLYLLKALLEEQEQYRDIRIPSSEVEQERLLRGLFNVRPPVPPSDDRFFEAQDKYLQRLIDQKGITDVEALTPVSSDDRLFIWQGDITTIKADAIVNAANSAMLGCFAPNHACIDNAIHTFAGIQLRIDCDKIMHEQECREETGKAKITSAYNLPSKYVLHTVGPIISSALTDKDCKLLTSCYQSCLELAEKNNLSSVVFCCISTGEFHFPNEVAAQIAVDSVKEFLEKKTCIKKVVFNVFKDIDYRIYQGILG